MISDSAGTSHARRGWPRALLLPVSLFEAERDFQFGLPLSTLAKETLGISYAEAEEYALSVYRQYVLDLPDADAKEITQAVLACWKPRVLSARNSNSNGERPAVEVS